MAQTSVTRFARTACWNERQSWNNLRGRHLKSSLCIDDVPDARRLSPRLEVVVTPWGRHDAGASENRFFASD